jgi:hypothetical protein
VRHGIDAHDPCRQVVQRRQMVCLQSMATTKQLLGPGNSHCMQLQGWAESPSEAEQAQHASACKQLHERDEALSITPRYHLLQAADAKLQVGQMRSAQTGVPFWMTRPGRSTALIKRHCKLSKRLMRHHESFSLRGGAHLLRDFGQPCRRVGRASPPRTEPRLLSRYPGCEQHRCVRETGCSGMTRRSWKLSEPSLCCRCMLDGWLQERRSGEECESGGV